MAPSLPQSCVEVSAAPKFDYPICHISEHLSVLWKSVWGLCLVRGGPGSIWKNIKALVRSTRVFGRFAFAFRTDLHFADVFRSQQQSDHNVGALDNYAGMSLSKDTRFRKPTNEFLPPPVYSYPPSQSPFPVTTKFHHPAKFNIPPSS